jgi:hypothetical protein
MTIITRRVSQDAGGASTKRVSIGSHGADWDAKRRAKLETELPATAAAMLMKSGLDLVAGSLSRVQCVCLKGTSRWLSC